MFRLYFITALLLVVSFPSVECKENDTARNKRAELIKGNKNYYHGTGYGDTQDEADRQSILDLCRKISMAVNSSAISNNSEDSESFSSQDAIATFVTLSNSERFDIEAGPNHWEILRYVERSQVDNDMKLRQEKIRSLVFQGRKLEKHLEIASALKYYNWAYALSRTYTAPVMLDIDNMNHDAKTWLSSHINNIFNTLAFELDGVEEHAGDIDPYLVNLSVTFMGQAVGDLDFSYVNNGNRVYDQHIKNGRATLAFEKLPADKIDISISYKYEKEGSQYDSELKAIYDTKRAPTFAKSDIEIPCRGQSSERFQVKERKFTKQEKEKNNEYAKLAPSIVAVPRNKIETVKVSEDSVYSYIDVLSRIKQAIESKKYSTVSELFTPDGYSLFIKMMQSGQIKCVKKHNDWKIEKAANHVIAKSIPVIIKYNGGHTVSEDIVFRFGERHKIESVAYALTKRAEDDIFRQNSWDISARYAILQFMEDYQTAYALKRIDYIDKIFSDDAIIIWGKKNPNAPQKVDGTNYLVTNSYTYTRESKQEFIERLKKDFPNKKYIKLTFEDNEIKEQSGIYTNIFWIEIKQFYSSSNYNDDGYLTLMIDMREANPTIKVRTWAPNKISLSEIMSRYSME